MVDKDKDNMAGLLIDFSWTLRGMMDNWKFITEKYGYGLNYINLSNEGLEVEFKSGEKHVIRFTKEVKDESN